MDKARARVNQQLENDGFNQQCRGKAAEMINQILKSDIKIGPDDLVFLGSFLRNSDWYVKNDFGIRERKLVNAIFNHYYPQIKSGRFYHFTGFEEFENILKSKTLRLFNLHKRKSAEYFSVFYEDHGLLGYKKPGKDGILFWEKIMQETFYISFANPAVLSDKEEASLWRTFARKGFGVRLEFEITSRIPDFRFAYYRPEELHSKKMIINQLTETIRHEFNRIFTVSGISKMGAFYLNGELSEENEARLVIKANTDDYPFRFKPKPEKSKIQFIELPFESKYASVHLVNIQPGIYRKREDVQQVVNRLRRILKPIVLNNSNLI